jgi:hypothetical protein
MDLLVNPSPTLLDYVERIQVGLSLGMDPKLLADRTPAGREKDLELLRQVAKRARTVPAFDELEPIIQPSYAAVASPQAFEAQIEQLTLMATQHESILALRDLLDVWNHVSGIVGRIIQNTDYTMKTVMLATSVRRSLSARTFLSPAGDVQVILFFARIFSFLEHVSFLLPLAIREEAINTESLDDFPQLVIQESNSFTTDAKFAFTVRSMLSRYRDGAIHFDRKWSHNFGEYRRLAAQDMASAMQFFVMAHEIAHCICEHEGNIQHWSFAADTGSEAMPVDAREMERNWEQEEEADFIGFRLGMAISHRHGIPNQTYSWACYLLFDALSRCSLPLSSVEPKLGPERWRQRQTHPPFAQRQAWIEEIANSYEPTPGSSGGPITFEPVKALCILLDNYV